MPRCLACGVPSAAGARFCGECGAALRPPGACPVCGATEQHGRFCSACGTALAHEPPSAVPELPRVTRKTTSVLFGDLVGFTPLAQSRDVEDVRDLLSRYFQRCRTVVERYGGTVEKFIGDAVMAVWGVPTVHEDDAERAVRAALELTAAVHALGEQAGAPGLQMRVGVVTGEVAVTEGAVGEGMVAGDAVNTAARVQAQASPGQVWVDTATRDRAGRAVDFTDAGAQRLKGMDDPVQCWEAHSIVAAVGGALRMDGLVAPLTGRSRELSVVTELFHATREGQQPRLLVVSGAPGMGKSRLGDELQYYLDGLSGAVWWHRGRCPAYGEAVAFAALTHALRGRFDIPAGADVATVDTRLAAGLERFVPDPDQRRWLGPRLATLLGGSAAMADLPREDLFAAWTAFFSSLSVPERGGEDTQVPVVLLVDDAQHADDAFLDFLEHAVDRGRFPLFVVVLGRPELLDRRPGLASGRRRSSVHLDPLPDRQMRVLVESLVAGLSDHAWELLVRRAEGIPLFAVETVRWLIDRDAVRAVEGRYVATSGTEAALGDAAAPATVEALVAARIDELDPAGRGLLADAAVLGPEFDLDGLVALGQDSDASAEVLDALVRRDFLRPVHRADGRPTGSWAFGQAVVRSVAYGQLSRRDRRARHLAVADHLAAQGDPARALGPIIARHLLDAVAVAPQPDDDALTGRAVELLREGAQRAVDVGAPAEALRLVARALAALGKDQDQRAALKDLAGAAHFQLADPAAARTSFEEAIHGHEAAGRVAAAARSASALSWTLRHQGLSADALRTIVPWWRRLAAEQDRWPELQTEERGDHESAWLLVLLEVEAGLWGVPEAGAEFPDLPEPATVTLAAIGLAERHGEQGVLGRALHSLALELGRVGASREAARTFERAAQVAEEAGRPAEALGALSNLCAMLVAHDLPAARRAAEHGVALGEQAPVQPRYEYVQAHLALCLWLAGDWDGLREILDRIEGCSALGSSAARVLDAVLAAETGRPSPRRWTVLPPAEDPHLQAYRAAADELAGVRPRLDTLVDAVERLHRFFGQDDDLLWTLTADLAVDEHELSAARRLVTLASSQDWLPRLLEGQVRRVRGRLGLASGDDLPSTAAELEAAVAALDAFGVPFYAARARLDLATVVSALGDPRRSEGLLDEAAATFRGLGAAPWLERVRRLQVPPQPAGAGQ